MNWRPRGWATRSVKSFTGKDMMQCTGREVFEAGADAMLDALRQTGYKASKELGNINHHSEIYDSGRVVFIPGKE